MCHEIAIGVVADDEIRPAAKLCQDFLFSLQGKALKIRPYRES